ESSDESEILERRQLVVDHRVVGDPSHDLLGGHRIGQRVDAENRNGPGIRAQQPDHHFQGCGFARAVGTKQRIELASAHPEVEAVDRRPIEALAEAEDFQGPKRLSGSWLANRDTGSLRAHFNLLRLNAGVRCPNAVELGPKRYIMPCTVTGSQAPAR